MTDDHTTHWVCTTCKTWLGATVRDGKLYIGDVMVYGAVIPCKACGSQRTWYGKRKQDRRDDVRNK